MKLKALIFHTFRELFAKATLGVLAGVSTLIILFVLAGLSATENAGSINLNFFGNPAGPPLPPDKFSEFIMQMQMSFANGMYAGIVLFGVFATAGVIPDMLEKGTVDLYLSKPIARMELLLGKYLGAVAVLFTNALYFIGALWIVMGLKLGVWNIKFLLSAISLTVIFGCLFSVVALLGVMSRNTALSIIGAFLYLFIVSPILFHRQEVLFPFVTSNWAHTMLDGLYNILPQISGMQEDLNQEIIKGAVNWKPFLQSFISCTAIFFGTAELLRRKDF